MISALFVCLSKGSQQGNLSVSPTHAHREDGPWGAINISSENACYKDIIFIKRGKENYIMIF